MKYLENFENFKSKLNKILIDVSNGSKNVVDAEKEILNIIDNKEDTIKPQIPVLVGHLNRDFGYNNFKPIEKGTEVYEINDKYFFEIFPLSGGKPIKQSFYKKDLKPAIDFI